MRPKFDRYLWILLCCFIATQCILGDINISKKLSGRIKRLADIDSENLNLDESQEFSVSNENVKKIGISDVVTKADYFYSNIDDDTGINTNDDSTVTSRSIFKNINNNDKLSDSSINVKLRKHYHQQQQQQQQLPHHQNANDNIYYRYQNQKQQPNNIDLSLGLVGETNQQLSEDELKQSELQPQNEYSDLSVDSETSKLPVKNSLSDLSLTVSQSQNSDIDLNLDINTSSNELKYTNNNLINQNNIYNNNNNDNDNIISSDDDFDILENQNNNDGNILENYNNKNDYNLAIDDFANNDNDFESFEKTLEKEIENKDSSLVANEWENYDQSYIKEEKKASTKQINYTNTRTKRLKRSISSTASELVPSKSHNVNVSRKNNVEATKQKILTATTTTSTNIIDMASSSTPNEQVPKPPLDKTTLSTMASIKQRQQTIIQQKNKKGMAPENSGLTTNGNQNDVNNPKKVERLYKTLSDTNEGPSLSLVSNKKNENLNRNIKGDANSSSKDKSGGLSRGVRSKISDGSAIDIKKNNTRKGQTEIFATKESHVQEMPSQMPPPPIITDPNEGDQIIIISEDGETDAIALKEDSVESRNIDEFLSDEPKALPLRPIIRGPYDDDHQGEFTIEYAEQHSSVKLNCEVDMDIVTSVWFKDTQTVHLTDRSARPTDNRFIRETRGGLTITNVMLEDDGKWQCEAENARGYVENGRPVKLIVLDRPKPPYLLIDSRRLDAGNIFVPVKENSELSLACVSEGGNPKPTLTWEVLLSPGVDRHAQNVAAKVLELQEVKNDKDKEPYKINSGAISEAKLPAVYRAHHNARILCVMEHPTLKMRQNASLLLDVQYTPSFAISRTPGFGYPLREGIEVSLKCDVDSNPPSTPVWQKDDGDPPVPQTGDGFLNFTSIRREHSGWYKCTSRHLNYQYSSIGYYLSIRYDSVDVTSEPVEQDTPLAASHNPYKAGNGNGIGQLEVQLGGAVTLQCPQGSLGCWSHLDPISARLKGLGVGLSTPTGQFSLKDVVYQDAGTYKCIGQSAANRKKLEVLQMVSVAVKGRPTVVARNATPVAYPGSPLHLSVEFCANPPAFAARWLHGDRVYTPGNQYGIDVLAYGVIDLPTPYCKEARLTYVHMHEKVPRTFYFIVSSPGGVAEAIFHINFTLRHKTMSNSVDNNEDEELSEPEEIHFPVFGSSANNNNYTNNIRYNINNFIIIILLTITIMFYI